MQVLWKYEQSKACTFTSNSFSLFSCFYNILECLQVHENQISLRKRFGGTAQLRTLEGALVSALLVVKQNFL